MISAILVVVFGFLFLTVAARIVGLIGASANPISGMTIATLMRTSLIFVAVGWTPGLYSCVALSIGGIVCIAGGGRARLRNRLRPASWSAQHPGTRRLP